MQAELQEKNIHFPFLDGGGEMGELTRSFHWSGTSLGLPQFWPQSLRTTISILLNSRHPMFLWWGDDLIQFYNDAYRPSLGQSGKHPTALGQKGKDCWPEIWPTIKPLIDKVLSGKGATWSEDQLIPIYRNGKLEDVYWTFGYSPVINEKNKIEGVLVICNETTEKINNLKKLTESKQELSFAIDASDLGTWDINPSTQRLVSNDRLKNWFGLKSEDDIDLGLAINIIAPKDRQKVSDAIQAALKYESGGHFDIECTVIHPQTNKERVVRAKGKAIFDENNIAKRFSGILLDITEKRVVEDRVQNAAMRLVQERTQELENKNRELERSNASLEEFTHIASHDLKEPMRKIHFFIDRLRAQIKDRITEEEALTFSRIESANDRMVLLIDDLLLYSRFSQRPQQMEAVDLNEKLSKVLEDLELDIQQKKAIITIKKLPIVYGYQGQLQQLFQNLVGNALKYHQKELPPDIYISSSMVDGGEIDYLLPEKKYHLIRVKDNGIGFEQEYSERIFQMFQRLHGNAEYRGTGVGLAIARKVADNHHGRITARSTPGKGSEFMVYYRLEDW